MLCFYAKDLHKDTTILNVAQLTKPSRILIEQESDPTLLNFKRKMSGLPSDELVLIYDARYMQYSRNKKRIIIRDDILCRPDNTIMILLQLVTCKSFCLHNYSKCYCNHYMEQLTNTQAFQKGCKIFDKNSTFPQLQQMTESGSLSVICAS